MNQRVIIAGGRNVQAPQLLLSTLLVTGPPIAWPFEIVCGMCPTGVDAAALKWASSATVTVVGFPAEWKKHGNGAGSIRNREMARYAAAGPAGGVLFLIWDGKSKGSASMLREARAAGVKTIVQVVIEVAS